MMLNNLNKYPPVSQNTPRPGLQFPRNCLRFHIIPKFANHFKALTSLTTGRGSRSSTSESIAFDAFQIPVLFSTRVELKICTPERSRTTNRFTTNLVPIIPTWGFEKGEWTWCRSKPVSSKIWARKALATQIENETTNTLQNTCIRNDLQVFLLKSPSP